VRILSPSASLSPSGSAIFTGAVSTAAVLQDPCSWEQAKVSFVRFEPGSRTQWHTHDGDQLLLVVEGTGHIGSDEGRLDVRPGDTVLIPAGTRHYHGASSTEPMAHYSILGGSATELLGTVSPWPPADINADQAR
jgi:quercetin dioxygenase-like cupin family protein